MFPQHSRTNVVTSMHQIVIRNSHISSFIMNRQFTLTTWRGLQNFKTKHPLDNVFLKEMIGLDKFCL